MHLVVKNSLARKKSKKSRRSNEPNDCTSPPRLIPAMSRESAAIRYSPIRDYSALTALPGSLGENRHICFGCPIVDVKAPTMELN
jgi:hypothetical protein